LASLLEVNRQDCLALQHVTLKAARELECWRAYERTTYCVDDSPGRIRFRAGDVSRSLDALVARHDATRWALITAWNPESVRLTRAENDVRQRSLERDAQQAGYQMLRGEGIGADPNWQPEESILILGISRKAARQLGRQYGQLAIVVGHRDGPGRLVSCATAPRGRTRGQSAS
jgi:hypothetical protein